MPLPPGRTPPPARPAPRKPGGAETKTENPGGSREPWGEGGDIEMIGQPNPAGYSGGRPVGSAPPTIPAGPLKPLAARLPIHLSESIRRASGAPWGSHGRGTCLGRWKFFYSKRHRRPARRRRGARGRGRRVHRRDTAAPSRRADRGAALRLEVPRVRQQGPDVGPAATCTRPSPGTSGRPCRVSFTIVEIRVATCEQMTYSGLISGLPIPTSFNLIESTALRARCAWR